MGVDSDLWDLSLKRIIGSTVSSPTAFDSLPSTRSFVYTAGGVAIVNTLDAELRVSRRFFRARPSITSLAPQVSSLHSLPGGLASEARKLSLTPVRDGGGLAIASSSLGDWEDSPTSKTWTARERIKAASCVSFSPDGRYLAVGEVRVYLWTMCKMVD